MSALTNQTEFQFAKSRHLHWDLVNGIEKQPIQMGGKVLTRAANSLVSQVVKQTICQQGFWLLNSEAGRL